MISYHKHPQILPNIGGSFRTNLLSNIIAIIKLFNSIKGLYPKLKIRQFSSNGYSLIINSLLIYGKQSHIVINKKHTSKINMNYYDIGRFLTNILIDLKKASDDEARMLHEMFKEMHSNFKIEDIIKPIYSNNIGINIKRV